MKYARVTFHATHAWDIIGILDVTRSHPNILRFFNRKSGQKMSNSTSVHVCYWIIREKWNVASALRDNFISRCNLFSQKYLGYSCVCESFLTGCVNFWSALLIFNSFNQPHDWFITTEVYFGQFCSVVILNEHVIMQALWSCREETYAFALGWSPLMS